LEKSELLKKFCSRLVAIERRSVLTKECYRFEIKKFLDFIEEKKTALGDVDPAFLSAYLAARKSADKIDSRSAAKAISALRSFFQIRNGRKACK